MRTVIPEWQTPREEYDSKVEKFDYIKEQKVAAAVGKRNRLQPSKQALFSLDLDNLQVQGFFFFRIGSTASCCSFFCPLDKLSG